MEGYLAKSICMFFKQQRVLVVVFLFGPPHLLKNMSKGCEV